MTLMTVAASSSATIAAWLSAVLLVVCMPICWWLLWRLWHQRAVPLRPNNPYSLRQQEMLYRMYPASIVCVTAMLIFAVFSGFVGQHTLVEKIVLGVLGIVFFGAAAIGFSVHLLGRPRWAIAPVLRDREDRGEFQRTEGPGSKPRVREPARARPADWLDPESQEWVNRQMGDQQSHGRT